MLKISHVYRLGVKELWGLWRDPVMLLLILFSFTLNIYTAATAMPDGLRNAPIAIVDQDRSALTERIRDAFYPPTFMQPVLIDAAEADAALDQGLFTFVLTIPSGFQADLLASRAPKLLLSVDATRMSQAFTGNGYIDRIVNLEVQEFLSRSRAQAASQVTLELRARFNPTLDASWFGALMQVINMVTMISIILTGAALIREREHGTIEHLLVMPVTPLEIMLAKVWAMGLVVLVATALSLTLVIQTLLQVPVAGSVALFLGFTALHLFATTSMGIFMATVTRTMPQFGLLLMMTLLPLQMLSGGMTPRESMPEFVQTIMLAAPTTHFVAAAQAILYRGAGFDIVWPQLLWLIAIGAVLFWYSARRFRVALSSM